ncbi:MAG: nucleotidyl transferase AbiEii/AbiGii toxin family protein [Gammaproteobacteria bacterium]|nr:nucleotidyl transferase AbiEii/AbiGii toxin family protein [Gammaproteobacteria bacterium]
MREVLGNLVDAVLAIDRALAASDLPYAFGGALALSAWAEPRATRDIDLNVWVDPDDITDALEILESAGVVFERDRACREARERGMFVGFLGEYRIDVFVPSVPFYEKARQRICSIAFLDRELPLLSPETLAVFKMLFFRGKDLVDLERLLAIRGQDFDTDFVRDALIDMMGAGDERIEVWDRLVSQAV